MPTKCCFPLFFKVAFLDLVFFFIAKREIGVKRECVKHFPLHLLTFGMSIYRKLDDGSNISQFETADTLLHAANSTLVSPVSPVSNQGIPSMLEGSYGTSAMRTFMSTGQNERSGTTYGPASSGYASLRYYGDGPY